MQRGQRGFSHERLHQESSGNNVDALLNRTSTATSTRGSAGTRELSIARLKLPEISLLRQS